MKYLIFLLPLFLISCSGSPPEIEEMIYAQGLARYEMPTDAHNSEAYNNSLGKWDVDTISYYVRDYPVIGSKQGYLDTIQLAFNHWSEHIGKYIVRDDQPGKHEIEIQIEKGDGLGGELARAWFPPINNLGPKPVPMRFDYWDVATVEGRARFDFFQLSCTKQDTTLESGTVTKVALSCTGNSKLNAAYR